MAGDRRMVFGRATPTFSDDGKYLMLTSSRDFKPIFGQTDFTMSIATWSGSIWSRSRRRPRTRSGRAATKSERRRTRTREKDKDKDGDKDKAKPEKKPAMTLRRTTRIRTTKAKKPVTVKVDLDGIQDRLVALEIPSGELHEPPPGRRPRFSTCAARSADDAATTTTMAAAIAEVAPLLLQPGRPERDRAGRREQLRDHASTARRCW